MLLSENIMTKIKVIVLNKNISFIGNIIKVNSGYARNYLIPYNKAVYATSYNIKKYNKKYLDNIKFNNNKLSKFKKLYNKIIFLSPLEIKLRCDKKNKLFGSIKNIDIKNIFLEKLNIKISKKCIIFPNGPIKYLGNYIIKISLHKENVFDFLINIKSLN